MKDFRELSGNILCKIGKFGVGKSLVLGMFDIEVPPKLKESGEDIFNKETSTLNRRKRRRF